MRKWTFCILTLSSELCPYSLPELIINASEVLKYFSVKTEVGILKWIIQIQTFVYSITLTCISVFCWEKLVMGYKPWHSNLGLTKFLQSWPQEDVFRIKIKFLYILKLVLINLHSGWFFTLFNFSVTNWMHYFLRYGTLSWVSPNAIRSVI